MKLKTLTGDVTQVDVKRDATIRDVKVRGEK